MKVLGIYGSPRQGGNSDMLLDEALKGARDAGADVSSVRCCALQIAGCVECGGCDETGECVVQDDMQNVYPLLLQCDVIILASPMFFYGMTSQAKAVIDRCQALWCRKRLKGPGGQKRALRQGGGYLICVGATKGKTLFDGVELVAKYFYDALDLPYGRGVFIRSVEGKGDIAKHPEALTKSYELGKTAVTTPGWIAETQ